MLYMYTLKNHNVNVKFKFNDLLYCDTFISSFTYVLSLAIWSRELKKPDLFIKYCKFKLSSNRYCSLINQGISRKTP